MPNGGPPIADDERLRLIEDERRRIERNLDYTLASADLDVASTWRLWSLAGLALLLGLSMFLGAPEPLTWPEIIRVLAMVAAASAAFHVATWVIIRIWLRLAHRRR